MSLRTLDLPLLLNTSDPDLFRDFFVSALNHSLRYDRGVGYFASGWLRLAAQGIAHDSWSTKCGQDIAQPGGDHPLAPTVIHRNHPGEARMRLCSLALPRLLIKSDHDLLRESLAQT